jgi:hypothetical protein
MAKDRGWNMDILFLLNPALSQEPDRIWRQARRIPAGLPCAIGQ